MSLLSALHVEIGFVVFMSLDTQVNMFTGKVYFVLNMRLFNILTATKLKNPGRNFISEIILWCDIYKSHSSTFLLSRCTFYTLLCQLPTGVPLMERENFRLYTVKPAFICLSFLSVVHVYWNLIKETFAGNFWESIKVFCNQYWDTKYDKKDW